MALGQPLEITVERVVMTSQGDNLCKARREPTPAVIVFSGWFGVERYSSWKLKV